MKKLYKRKKIMCIILASVLLLGGLFGIEVYQSHQKYKMIFIPKSKDEDNDFWTSLMAGAQMGAEEYGIEFQIIAGKSEEDIEGQNQIIKWAMKQKPDALLVSPCSYTESTDMLKEVKKAGIKLVLIDSIVDEDIADLVIATDNVAAGKKLGEYTATKLSQHAKVAIVGHVKGASTAIDREAGIRSGLGDKVSCIQEVVFCGSQFGKAYQLSVELLEKYPDLDMIIGLNEYSAVGAARAMRDLKLKGKVDVVGFDSSIEEIQLMEAGIIQGVIIQKPFNMGYLGIEQTYKMLNYIKVKKELDSGYKLINMDNLYTEENQKLLFPFVGNQEKQ